MRQSGSGFTLIEVVVATAILALIFSIVFGSFFYTINNAEEQEERASIYHRANFILNNISENISSAYVPLSTLKSESQESENATVLAQPAEEEEETQPVFAGKDASDKEADTDSLSAFIANIRFGGSANGGGFVYVKYDVVSADEAGEEEVFSDVNNPFLLRCSVESPFFSKETEELDEQAQTWDWELSVRSFSVEYSDGAGWLNEWSYEEKKELPMAIKVEIELADSSGASYPFSTIAPIHVNTVLGEPAGETGEEEDETEETPKEAGTESSQTEATSTSTATQSGTTKESADLFAQ
jgi:prepilin-type N-terminal cleavage/methylation domain-containing protein